jgi:hypothetical protein
MNYAKADSIYLTGSDFYLYLFLHLSIHIRVYEYNWE